MNLHNYVEAAAKDNGIKAVQLPASLTAVDFYKKLGYHTVREAESEANGKNIVMEKNI